MKIDETKRQQLQEQSRILTYTNYLAEMATLNTGFIPKGQQFAKQLQALAKILYNRRQEYIAMIFDEMNIKQAKLNMDTGELEDIVLKEV